MGNNTKIYQSPEGEKKREKKKSPISQLRLERNREGANSRSTNRLHYLYMKMFSASINLPCPSTLINCRGCHGNLPNSITALQRGECAGAGAGTSCWGCSGEQPPRKGEHGGVSGRRGEGCCRADPRRPNNSNYPGSTHSAALRGMTQHGSTGSRLVPNCLTKHS